MDIWAKFPQELCEKITNEFDEKIRICQKEEGKILNKALIKKYKKKEEKITKSNYDWNNLKQKKCFRIVYNDKIIELIKKKVIQKIKNIAKENIMRYKSDHPIGKVKTGLRGAKYKDYKKSRQLDLKEIEANYDNLISYVKKISPLNFINEFLKQNVLTDQKHLINTNLSKKIEINEKILTKIMLGIESKNKELSLEEEIDLKINNVIKRSKMKSIKEYLPHKINIDPFPVETKNKKEEDDDLSLETQLTFKDTCNLLEDLNEKIIKLRKDNKDALEKEKKIKIISSNEENQVLSEKSESE